MISNVRVHDRITHHVIGVLGGLTKQFADLNPGLTVTLELETETPSPRQSCARWGARIRSGFFRDTSRVPVSDQRYRCETVSPMPRAGKTRVVVAFTVLRYLLPNQQQFRIQVITLGNRIECRRVDATSLRIGRSASISQRSRPSASNFSYFSR